MRKISLLVSIIMAILFVFSGCGTKTATSSATGNQSNGKKTVKAVLLTATGGLGDRSFNDAAYNGFKKAEKELGAEIKVIEPKTSADYLQSLKLAASADYDFIMTVGNDWVDALNTVAPNYPNKKFAGINVKVQLDNVAVAKFADHEGSFVVGALAAMMSKSGTVGFVGGADFPAINRFAVGFEEGAKYAKKDIKVLTTYVGSFSDPSKGKEFTVQVINEGADVVMQCAGKTGEGVFEALKENKKVYGIGVDQDQDYLIEGRILTSMVKNVGTAAYDFIKQIADNKFVAGDKVYGLAENGVGTTEMKFTKNIIPEDVLKKLETIKKDIISGKIVVTDVFKKK